MKTVVRKADLDDINWLIYQIRAFEKFSGFKRRLMEDEVEARGTLAQLITDHVVLIVHNGEERLGFIAGCRTPHPFNKRLRVLAETFWWVPEEYRATRAGYSLLREFEAIGRATADWVIFSLEHDSPVRDEHLRKRGFRQVEKAFLLEV